MTLRVDEVSLAFGQLQALDGLSLAAEPGRIVGLIGPNGSGKSTLLNVVSGIYAPQSGTVHVGGRRITAFQPDIVATMGVGRTFQVPRLARRLTVFQNMLVGGRGHRGENLWNLFVRIGAVRTDEHSMQERAYAIVRRLGLQDKINELAGQLSGGQQKLLSMGVLLMSDPQILLIDEPAAGVNPVLIEQQIVFLSQLRDEGRTILLIEHNMDMITGLCDDVYVLDGGRVLAYGTPDEVRRDPAVMQSYLGTHERKVAS